MADIKIESEITGTVWKIETAVGNRVAEDDVLMILESMKMEIPVLATDAGVVKSIEVEEGANIAEGQSLVILEG
ncbi:acetyl-CoA carboxylase biotin carboxyl carrier protein subunit [Oceanibacterium hippocampi]|uniref:Biotin/lipoyl attachment protein n=1 Tax=Oceanibacterium hippocampi TaxID=745714 RepID=A0A1Y5SXC9_9PROT|nr:acetyl-CoA carboxylase biotin carboxyl carrier protein subunit [Oceanibacterium hippocampi]SLN47333.1 Biotin/lipoyl attachment protein [Oceanibacterium hippocampi]